MVRRPAGVSGGNSGVGALTITDASSNGDAPANGRRPVSISKNTTPSAQMSLRESAGADWMTSGAM